MGDIRPSLHTEELASTSPRSRADTRPVSAVDAPQWTIAAGGARTANAGEAADAANAAEVRLLLLQFGLTEEQIAAAAKVDPLLWHYECAHAA